MAIALVALLCSGVRPALAGQHRSRDRGTPSSEAGKPAASVAAEAGEVRAGDAATRPSVRPAVQMRGPRLSGGRVPGIGPKLDKAVDTVARCVAEHGGLSVRRGRIDLQFLVRARGRAEAVEIAGTRGVEAEAARCVQQVLKNRWLGAPTAEPVGVDLTFLLSVEQPADRTATEPARPPGPQRSGRGSASLGGDTVRARDVRPAHDKRSDRARGRQHHPK
jgi:hypothetical protein